MVQRARVWGAAAVVVLAMGLGACGGGGGDRPAGGAADEAVGGNFETFTGAPPGGSLVVLAEGDPDDLNPLTFDSSPAFQVVHLLFRALARRDSTLRQGRRRRKRTRGRVGVNRGRLARRRNRNGDRPDGRFDRGWGGLLQKAEHVLSLAERLAIGRGSPPPKSKESCRDQAANSSSRATRNEKMPRASAKAMPMNSVAVCEAAADGLRSAPDR